MALRKVMYETIDGKLYAAEQDARRRDTAIEIARTIPSDVPTAGEIEMILRHVDRTISARVALMEYLGVRSEPTPPAKEDDQ